MEIMVLPFVKVLLIAIVFLGLLVEIKTAGTGVGALIALIAAGVFFGSHMVKGLVSFYEVAVFLAGLMFIAIEMLTPGIGVFGGIGLAAILYSFVLALGGTSAAVYLLFAGVAVAVAGFALIVKKLPSSKVWNKVVLNDVSTSSKGYVSASDHGYLLHKEGNAATDLRPAGTAMIEGEPVDVVTNGGFIEKGTRIQVVSVNGGRVVVRGLES